MSENSKLFDPNLPSTLKSTQEWFGSIIGRPIDAMDQMMPISPCGHPMEREASLYIAPSPTLQPHQRIEIYNQQYWWRLYNILQEAFPLLLRLFGYADFNQSIASPYLVKYPPNHWSLGNLGARLLKWVEEEYHQEDKELIYNATKVDWAFDYLFTIPPYPTLNPSIASEGNSEVLLGRTFYLQSYVEIFCLPYNLFTFRDAFIKEKDGDYWIDHDFPELPKDKEYYFVVYRTQCNHLRWQEISRGEYSLLQSFQKGASIEQACDILEKQDENLYNEAIAHIASWFQTWMARRWLCLENTVETI